VYIHNIHINIYIYFKSFVTLLDRK